MKNNTTTMSKRLVNKLHRKGITFLSQDEYGVAFLLNGWKRVTIPILTDLSYKSIIDYLKFY